MKRLFILLSITFLLTGCSVSRLYPDHIDDNLEILLGKNNNVYNAYYEGYKYYLPKGIQIMNKEDYNALLKDSHGNRYYLYVDVISYFHKSVNDYKVSNNSYYSKKLSFNKKTGYLQIDKIDSKYFIQYVFNYAKIEAYVDKKDLDESIWYMSSILGTIKFNDTILESLIGENALDYKEEDYTLFKADSSKESFLDVVEREETDKYKKDIEDEKIELND